MSTSQKYVIRSILVCSVLTLAALLLSLALWRVQKPAAAAPVFTTIAVNTLVDENGTGAACSLREAITAANTNAPFGGCPAGAPGLDTIQFDVGVNTPTINLTSALPQITEPVIINGNTGGATRVELNGVGAGANANGLTITAGGSTLQALVINRFSASGVVLQTGNGNTVKGCIIGLNSAGTASQGNTSRGISITSANNLIGGTTATDRNVISGNGNHGIELNGAAATGNQIQGNFIGTDAAGTGALGNSLNGVFVNGGANNFIGGTAAGAGNLFSGNLSSGINLSNTTGNQVQGNLIGANAAGTAAVANGAVGVTLAASNNNTIGGTTAAARNLISGNTTHGVRFEFSSTGNLVQGNFIGTDLNGTAALGNGTDGVLIDSGSSSNTIGGTVAGAGNRIAFNTGRGVNIPNNTAINNRVSSNAIFSNGGLGIDLGGIGVTANDAGDADTGANNLQNFPVLTSAAVAGSNTIIQGTLNSTANTAFRIEFFSNPTCDASGNGEGQVFLGFANVTTTGNDASINVNLPVSVTPGQVVTATATDPANNTSEFSQCIPACSYAINPTMQSFTPAAGNGSVNVTATGGCAWTATSNATWINITSGSSGNGNGTVSYTVATNAGTLPRTGMITIADNTFTVSQAANGVLVFTDFNGGIPADWTVVHNGNGRYPDNTPATWTAGNPCNRMIPAPFSGTFAIVDAKCANLGATFDEQLITPSFNASGSGTVYVEFYNRFLGATAPNNIGDLEVSIDGGVSWLSPPVQRFQGVNDGFPTPTTKSFNISPFIAANPTNARVRAHYFNGQISAAEPRQRSKPVPKSPTQGGEVEWAVDFAIYSFAINPTSQNFPASGGTGSVNVSTSAVVPAPQGAWTATSNAFWIMVTSGNGGTGNGTVNYSIAVNTGPARSGTVTIAGDTFTVSQATGLMYYPLPKPVRLLDTRSGETTACNNPGTPITGGSPFTLQARGACQGVTIPANAQAVVGNATVVNFLSGPGYITLYPSDAAQPLVSNLNYNANHIVPNAFTVGLGADGAFKIFAATTTHFIVDITGYYASPDAGGLYYHPLPNPVRRLDTRVGETTACTNTGVPLTGGVPFNQQARGSCQGQTILAAAQAIVGNATVVNFQSGAGFITLWPGGASQPVVSNLNYNANHIVPNAFTVGLGADGSFNIFATGTTHFIVDITGYYSAEATDVNGTGLLYYPLATPVRRLDTRAGETTACTNPGVPLSGGVPFTQAAQGLCQGVTIPATAQAVVGNATVVNFLSGPGFITLWPAGASQPVVSNLNYNANHIVPNAFVVKLGAGGAFNVFATSTTHFIADLTGYFAP